jgi:microcompartment protein CcmL/EutN
MHARGLFPNLLNQPAIGMLECTSISRGMTTCDAVVKQATVTILQSHPIDPGRYIVLFAGSVADVEEGLEAGEHTASDQLLDKLFLAQVHDAVIPSIRGELPLPKIEALGIVETHTVAGAIVGLDAALKAAQVRVIEIRLGNGIDGKGYFVVTGDLHDVEASLEAAVDVIGVETMTEVIPSPHPDFLKGSF